MSASAPPPRGSGSAAEPALDPERARLRRIGIMLVAGLVIVVGLVTVLLVTSDDTRDALVIDARDLDVSRLDRGDLVRVTGQTARLFEQDSFDNLDQTNAVRATEVEQISGADAGVGPGTVTLREVLDDDTPDRSVTVVGEVIDLTERGILAIGRPDE